MQPSRVGGRINILRKERPIRFPSANCIIHGAVFLKNRLAVLMEH